MATLLTHDAPQQFSEHRMIGDLSESVVRRIGRPLIDRAPRHVHRGKLAHTMAERPENGRTPKQVTLVEPTHLDQPSVVRWPIMRCQHPTDCLAVPILLVVPQREKRCELRVFPCGHQQQLTGVQHRLILDVVHVGQAPQDVGVQRLASKRFEVNVVGLQPTTLLLKLLDRNCHVNPSLRNAVRIAATLPHT